MPYTYAGLFTDAFIDRYGNGQADTEVTVYNAGTLVEATLYTDRTKATVAANPFTTDSVGNGSFYADPGEYDVVANGGEPVRIFVPLDVIEAAQDSDITTHAALATGIHGVGASTVESVAGSAAKVAAAAGDRRVQAYGGAIASDNIIAGYAGNAIASDLGACAISGGGSLNRENVIGGDPSTIGTFATKTAAATPNVAQAGTGANYSVIGGGYNNVAGGLASVIRGSHCSTGLSTTHGTVSGGSWNWITGTADYATIGGGTGNEASADYATIAGGDRNVASGAYSFTAGQLNTVSGAGAAALGSGSTASGASAVAIGQAHTVEGNYASAFGRGGRARSQGQRVLSTQERSTVGDSQASDVVLRRQTTDATVSSLGLTGGNTVHNILEGQTVAYDAVIVAREAATGDSARFTVRGLAKREPGGSSASVGTPTITQDQASAGAATWAVTMSVASAVGAVTIRVQGQAGKTIDWVGRMSMVEVLT